MTFTEGGVPIGETDNDEPGLATEQIIKSMLARHRARIVDFRSADQIGDRSR